MRNEDYWRGDGPNATGEGLPYLDKIEIVVAVDIDGRSSALRSGQFQIMHTSNADEIAAFLEDDGFESHVSDTFGETNYLMLNVAEGTNATTGQAAGPGRAPTPTARCCTCRAARRWPTPSTPSASTRSAPPASSKVANGPFPEGSIGWLEDTGYPKFDVDAAKAEFDDVPAGDGPGPRSRSASTRRTTRSTWSPTSSSCRCGGRRSATRSTPRSRPIEQGQYIGLGLTGQFEILGWRSHSGSDPDQQRRWWSSTTAFPLGEVGTNFGRFVDPVIDESAQHHPHQR